MSTVVGYRTCEHGNSGTGDAWVAGVADVSADSGGDGVRADIGDG